MPLPKQVAEQAAAADRMVAGLNGQPTPAPDATPAPTPAPADHVPTPQPTPTPAPQPAPAPAPASNSEAEEWKHKYSVLQGKYNAEVPAMQSQLQNALGAVGNMGRELDSLKEQLAQANARPTPVESRVTAADETTWGPDMIDMVRRAAQEEAQRMMQPLQQENAQLRAEITRLGGTAQQLQQRQQVSDEDRFWLSLGELVPNWATLNTDKAFIDWLAVHDDMLGTTRQNALTIACNELNAKRAASFFKTFLATLPPPVDPARELQRQASPSGQRGGSQPAPAAPGAGTVEIWSQEEVMNFYTDVNRGRWKHDPQGMLDMRARIDQAVAEGRVR